MRGIWLCGLLILVLLGASCGLAAGPLQSTPQAQPAATLAASKPAAEAAAVPPAAQLSAPGAAAPAVEAALLRPDPARWQQLRDAARREGKVVVVGPGFPGLRTGLVEGFQRAHGIAVEYLGLPSGEVITRVDREARVGSVSIDVNIGGVSACWALGERAYIDDVTGLLVDPEMLASAGWRDGAPRLIKPSPRMPKSYYCGIQTAEWVMTDLFVNRDIVRPEAIQSWRDLLRPEYKGKIASHDPRSAGPAQGPVAYLYTLFGEKYIEDLYHGQQVMLTTDGRQLAEWIARGTYPIGIAPVQAAVEPLRAEGLPIERVFPADGQGEFVGGYGTVQKITAGPNPNAAAVFINWFASREGQEMWEREMMETSLRTDVSHKVPEYVIPRPGVEYPINDYDADYYFSQRVPAVARLQELLGR